ncbi:MAG: hypothetical protein HC796_09940 [Synechococcaceae cyanobacterium RL_1_2]|nr:hypothetical protein [Synechococcaceae cyanobacterium RL_1_2]
MVAKDRSHYGITYASSLPQDTETSSTEPKDADNGVKTLKVSTSASNSLEVEVPACEFIATNNNFDSPSTFQGVSTNVLPVKSPNYTDSFSLIGLIQKIFGWEIKPASAEINASKALYPEVKLIHLEKTPRTNLDWEFFYCDD